MGKKRIDTLLVERGLAETRAKAKALIMAGEVTAGGNSVTKSGTLVDENIEIKIREPLPYVSRGGIKLAYALDAFQMDVSGMVAADIGASTGGFTDCLLQRGAKKVYAIDVGYGQLDYTLRQDERVVVMERTNARYPVSLPEKVDLATLDLSFISVTKVIPSAIELLEDGGNLLVLIKPQFEARRGEVGKGGIIKDPQLHARVLGRFINWVVEKRLRLLGLVASPILGSSGNRELYFEANMPAPMRFGITDNYGGDHQVSSQSLGLNEWYQIVGTYDGSEQKLYVNGELDNTLAWSGSFTINSGAMLGRDIEGGQYFNGSMDDIRIYNRVLSAEEVELLYHEGGWDLPLNIVSTSPVQNALNVAQNAAVAVTFDLEMDEASIDETTFVVHASQTGLLNGTYSYDASTYTATFTPDSPFKVGERVSVTLTGGVESVEGGRLDQPYTWTFTTEVTRGSGEFLDHATYPTGGGSYSVYTGDLDGDGDIDLAVANASSDYVSVLLGVGDGTFAAADNYSAGNHPISVTAADLDGDGNQDLAVANALSDNVSVLMGVGDGSFAGAVYYAAGDEPRLVIAVDFNGDGDLDLAVPNGDSDDVSVLLGVGDGTFAGAVSYTTVDYPRSVTAADFDSDGDLDLAVANSNTDNVSVLLGIGDGTFAGAEYYTAGDFPLSVTAADLDGDGNMDLIVANALSDNVSVLLGVGDGTFAGVINYTVGDYPYSVTAADLDGGGDLDLVVANGHSDNISVLSGAGDGTFAGAVNYAAGDEPRSLSATDLDGDGDLDLATANYNSSNVSVLLNAGGAPPVAGLVAYYPFNGDAADESGNGYDGTVFEATLAEDRFGNTASAYNFDGVDDYIRITHHENIDFNNSESFTLTSWINTTSSSGQFILDKHRQDISFTEQQYNMYSNEGSLGIGSISFGIEDVNNPPGATSWDDNNSYGWNDGNWHHIAAIRNRDESKLYLFIDGNHGWSSCFVDWYYWNHYVRIGGRIAFHDINSPGNNRPVLHATDYILRNNKDLKTVIRAKTDDKGVLVIERKEK